MEDTTPVSISPSLLPKPAQSAQSFLNSWSNVRLSIKESLIKAKTAMEKFANRHRSPAPPYAVGDLAWLHASHLPLKFSKLDDKYLGPFPITHIISPLAVQLSLPPTWKIHPTFHVSSLKPYRPPFDPSQLSIDSCPPPIAPSIYEVESIIAFNKARKKYLVKWKGYSDNENTWEPIKNLDGATDAILSFHRNNPGVSPPM